MCFLVAKSKQDHIDKSTDVFQRVCKAAVHLRLMGFGESHQPHLTERPAAAVVYLGAAPTGTPGAAGT